jgi:hypothetical protein
MTCVKPEVALAASRFWEFQCVDTVKISRDKARELAGASDVQELVAKQVEEVKNLGANCVAVGTPYDDEFIPYLKIWVETAHSQGLSVWFRGNLSGWEGWFDYPVMHSTTEHHAGITRFVVNNPTLFQDGDIFTPAPEPEMGKVIGDPRGSYQKTQDFLGFLQQSYENCNAAFLQIHKQVACGYFSVNGDIAKYVLTPEVVAKTGNVVVVDHYVKSAEQMVQDLRNLKEKFPGSKLVLGEFGAPIPDINGTMTQDQQAVFMDGLLGRVAASGLVSSVDYWTLMGGSTALYDDSGSSRKVVAVLGKYYKSITVVGGVGDSFGKNVSGVEVRVKDLGYTAAVDSDGKYEIVLPVGGFTLTASAPGFEEQEVSVSTTEGQRLVRDFKLAPTHTGLWYYIKLFLHNLFN